MTTDHRTKKKSKAKPSSMRRFGYDHASDRQSNDETSQTSKAKKKTTAPTKTNKKLPIHPPQGARGVVKPPLPKKPNKAKPTEKSVLADWAKSHAATGSLQVGPDNSLTYVFTFEDPMLGELCCDLSMKKNAVTACFWVKDTDTKRLVDAEMDRLRQGLLQKGLVVEGIMVKSMEETEYKKG